VCCTPCGVRVILPNRCLLLLSLFCVCCCCCCFCLYCCIFPCFLMYPPMSSNAAATALLRPPFFFHFVCSSALLLAHLGIAVATSKSPFTTWSPTTSTCTRAKQSSALVLETPHHSTLTASPYVQGHTRPAVPVLFVFSVSHW
jgi:hypothetical protein